jgi:glycosidase
MRFVEAVRTLTPMPETKQSSPKSVKELDFRPPGPITPSPLDWRDQVFYQAMLDRFDNNDPNVPPYDPKTAKTGRDMKQGWIFQGGNLRGVTRRLDYIKNLGATAIWITPPFKQRQDDDGSYHGYGIQDFLAIDPRFGTLQDLQDLTREAHARGMYVILDIVINHAADCFIYKGDGDHPFKQDGQYELGDWHRVGKFNDPDAPLGADDAVWPIELQDPDCFSRRGSIRNISSAGDDEAVNGDFFSLKDLNLKNPKAMDAMIQSFKYWICVADIDGYRIDTVRNIDPHSMATFCNAIHEYALSIGKRLFMIFGELVGDDDLLHKYVGGNTPVEGAHMGDDYPLMDACLDFPLYAVLDEVIKGEKSCDDVRKRYEYFKRYFRNLGEAGRYYVTFVDNHDQSHRPWRRFLAMHRDQPELTVQAIGFLLTNLGIPCIYYGTEQGFDGGGDRDTYIRECMFGGKWGAFDTTGMHFFDEKNPIYQAIAALAKIRGQEAALRYGRQYFRDCSGDGIRFGCPSDGHCLLAYSRVLDTREILVAINIDDKPRNDWVSVDPHLSSPGIQMVDMFNGGDPLPVVKCEGSPSAVRINLKPRGIAILRPA